MPRRAWLLVTSDILNDLYAYVHNRQLWVVDDALPEDVRFVTSRPRRGGAFHFLCESESFADVNPSDYPELPRPRLRKRDDWLREMAAIARKGN
jgi:hypothetical protein